MITLKLKFILLIFTSLLHFVADGQKINIILSPLYQKDLVKSMICLSTEDGKSLVEHILTENEIYDGLELNLATESEGIYCFSIINEYQIDSINEGHPYAFAKTYYDIGNDLIIRKFDHPVMEEFYKQNTVLISIKNPPRIENYIHYSRASISSWKTNQDEIWSQPNSWPGEDLFIVLKAWNDPKYRYIYFDEENIPIVRSNRPSISDAYTIDWKFLSTDIHHTDIKLPFAKRMRGTITGINSNTGKKCVLFESYGDTNKIIREYFDLFIPNNRFSDLKADLTWHNTFEYNYRIQHGIDLSLPPYEKELFTPESFDLDSVTIKTTLNAFPEYFRIIYLRDTKGSGLEIGKALHHMARSTWIVIGQNKKEINFTLPANSDKSLNEFSSLSDDSRWWFYRFDNVKVLEKDPQIEWINFFKDYNVLLVSYRNPYK